MTNFPILWARELGGWFHSTVTYVMLAVFSAGTGLVFWKVTSESVGEPFDPAVLMFGPLYFWLLVVVLVAVIAMRLFVDDRRTGMMEMVQTAPVTEWDIILSKYAGAMVVFGVAMLPLTLYPLAVAWGQAAVQPGADLDWTPLATGWLALLLCGAFFNAIGVLCAALLSGSATTILSVFMLCSLLFVIDQAAGPMMDGRIAHVASAIAVTPALRDFSRGIIDSRPVFLWISATVFCLFAAQRVLAKRRIIRGA